jgi:hypothetical protein
MTFANEPTEVLSAPSGMPAAGTVLLGRYRLRSLIGSGGTADVWAAHDEKRDRMVTIKLLRDREDPETRRRFLDEGLWLEAIEHPGIVRALGRHDVLGLTLIVFEYIEGTTLAERLLRLPPVSPRAAAAMVRQLGGALGALHAHGVLHLDLKPANIMVSTDGRVRLIDLGIADLIGNRREVIMGTPGYAAPEVREGRAPSRATDVYGLALIARELLGEVARDSGVGLVLRFGLFSDPARRPSSASRFAFALSLMVLLRELTQYLRDLRKRGAIDSLRTLGRRAVFGATAVVLLLVALALPRPASSVAGIEPPPASQSVRPYTLPPLSAYGARFEWQAPYPTAPAGGNVESILALRNVGAAGWFADRDGARFSLALADGTIVATQSSPYVGPGDVGIFTARFTAPSEPGIHKLRLVPVVEGTGQPGDLGLFVSVTVTPRQIVIPGR